jgi:hypothetical protein
VAEVALEIINSIRNYGVTVASATFTSNIAYLEVPSCDILLPDRSLINLASSNLFFSSSLRKLESWLLILGYISSIPVFHFWMISFLLDAPLTEFRV